MLKRLYSYDLFFYCSIFEIWNFKFDQQAEYTCIVTECEF